jgi:hypothetical protein
MKTHRRTIWVTLALIGMLLFATGSAAAGATMTEYTGKEYLVQVINPGEWTFPNGNVHLRGAIQEFRDETDDPRITGNFTIVANANWDANGAGNSWGTYRRVVVCEGGGDGIWEGTWTAKHYAGGGSTVHGVGHGISGCVEGLKQKQTVEFPGPGQFGAVTGRVLDPHGE